MRRILLRPLKIYQTSRLCHIHRRITTVSKCNFHSFVFVVQSAIATTFVLSKESVHCSEFLLALCNFSLDFLFVFNILVLQQKFDFGVKRYSQKGSQKYFLRKEKKKVTSSSRALWSVMKLVVIANQHRMANRITWLHPRHLQLISLVFCDEKRQPQFAPQK